MKAHIQKAIKKLLVYGLTQTEYANLQAAAAQKQIICKKINDQQTCLKVGQLLSEENPVSASELALNGKFALLSGFGKEIEDCLNIINGAAQGVIKAVATPHNIEWKFSDLCAAVSEEYRVMTKAE